MKFVLMLVVVCLSFNLEAKDVYGQKIKDLGGKNMDLKSYKGQPTLFVNIATQCGYTPQLEGLEEVYKKYKEKGLQVVGIPSNDFGGQTPEKGEEIKKFCKLNYGVSFALTGKTVVKGADKHPLIAELIEQSGDSNEVQWNFEKFLVDKNGKVLARFPSAVKPNDEKFLKKIEEAL